MSFRVRSLVVSAAISMSAFSAPAGAQLQRLTVTADGHPLTVWSRSAARPKGVILFLHGRTWSARPDFDLIVPGEQRSVMQAFMRRGYAVYALDARGYGGTPRDSTGWLTPQRAADDVAEVLRFLANKHPGVPKPTLVGWSYGSMVAHLTLQQRPELASAVVLFGYPWRPATALSAPTADTVTPRRARNTAFSAASDFIVKSAISQAAIDAYVAQALAADSVRADWRRVHEWNALDAAKLTVPTLLLHGEKDPLTPAESMSATFTALGTADKQWVVLPKSDHAALIENTLPAFVAAIIGFIERPAPMR
jgi:pimeloyl-ACP methyl ester carboxylesterase